MNGMYVIIKATVLVSPAQFPLLINHYNVVLMGGLHTELAHSSMHLHASTSSTMASAYRSRPMSLKLAVVLFCLEREVCLEVPTLKPRSPLPPIHAMAKKWKFLNVATWKLWIALFLGCLPWITLDAYQYSTAHEQRRVRVY